MKTSYKFKKAHHGPEDESDPLYEFGVDIDSISDEELALERLEWSGWTPEIIQTIVEECQALNEGEEYEYMVEYSDLLIIADISEVHFFDWRTERKDADIIWTFEKFIQFMTDFKEFVASKSQPNEKNKTTRTTQQTHSRNHHPTSKNG